MQEQRFKKGDRVRCEWWKDDVQYGTVESYEPDRHGEMYYRVKWDPVVNKRQLEEYGWNCSLHPAPPLPPLSPLEQAAIANAQALVNTVRAKREADEALGAFNKARQRFDREVEDLKRKQALEIEALRSVYTVKNWSYVAASDAAGKASDALRAAVAAVVEPA